MEVPKFLSKLGFSFAQKKENITFYKKDVGFVQQIMVFRVQIMGALYVAKIEEEGKTEYVAALILNNRYEESNRMTETELGPKLELFEAKLKG